MNIFIHELKSHLKPLIIWTLAILAVMVLYQSLVYPLFIDSREDVEKVFADFPATYLEMLGFDVEKMFSFSGFFSLTYNYILLMCTIFSSYVALSCFSHEKRGKCSDFLLSKPRGRVGIYLTKLAGVVLMLLVSTGFMCGACCLIYRKDTDLKRLALCFAGIFAVELVFAALGSLLAVTLRHIRSVSGIATALGFAGFIIGSLSAIVDSDLLKYSAVTKFFDPNIVYGDSVPSAVYFIIPTAAMLLLTAASMLKFTRGDIRI